MIRHEGSIALGAEVKGDLMVPRRGRATVRPGIGSTARDHHVIYARDLHPTLEGTNELDLMSRHQMLRPTTAP